MFTLRRLKDSKSLGPTLYKICSIKVEELIYYACSNIQRIYGDYNEEKCRQKVEELQKYILANLPAVVFDELLQLRGIQCRQKKQDYRIQFALYVHRNMRSFFIKHFFKVPVIRLNFAFFAMQLSKLENLVVLDLHLTCTDEILEVVAENCQKLAYINIVAQVEAMYAKDCFNALKLKYCLSDVGLGYLCKCKLLRKIKMNRMFRSNFGGKPITYNDIRRLVKSLPLLEEITFEDMGMVLASEMEDIRHLSLTCLRDFHPEPAHFDIIARLCPNLKQLSLGFSNTDDELRVADILRALASSGLKVSELQLVDISFSSDLVCVLESKGFYLNSLSIENMGSITSKTIQLIGRTCPNLMNLFLTEEPITGSTYSWQNPQYSNTHPVKCIFGNLQYLTLSGRTWTLDDILPLCLTSAKELKVLKILNTNKQGSLDAAIRQIIATNLLQELRTVYLLTHSKLTTETVKYFLRCCPKLMEVFFFKTASITDEQVDLLCDEMLKLNSTNFEKHFALHY